MYVRRNIRFAIVWRFSWRQIAWFTLWASLVTAAYYFARAHDVDLSLPFAPLGTIGVAVAFYVSFKNNQAYDRFWEARKIWGGVVNESRTWANMVLQFWTRPSAVGGAPAGASLQETQKRLIYRHLGWVNALRVQLRASTYSDRDDHLTYHPELELREDRKFEEEVYDFLGDDERRPMCAMRNTATQLIHRQGDEISAAVACEAINHFHEQSLHAVLRELYTLQGRCERIKNTPFPRQFAYFSTVFVRIFTTLLPFALLGEFAKLHGGSMVWLTIPFSVLISWIFHTLEAVGDTSEDPFENYINDVPMSALCRTIEIDLRQMLGETDLPPKVEPVGDILM